MRAEESSGYLGIFHEVGDLQMKTSLRDWGGKDREEEVGGRVGEVLGLWVDPCVNALWM